MSEELATFAYVRPINFGTAGTGKRQSHRVLWPDNGAKNCGVTYIRTPDGGGSNSGLHFHDIDQIFYIVSGEMYVEFSSEKFTAVRGDVVVFPKGVAHRNWNDRETEHLAFVGPAPDLSTTFTHRLAEGDEEDAPVDGAGVRSHRPIDFGIAGAAERHSDRVVWPDNFDGNFGVTYIRTPAGGGSPEGLHFHDVDQIFYLLSGQMFVEVNGEESTVQPGSLVVFPAGVPHRNWNDEETEHLAIWAPAPDLSTTYTHRVTT